MTKGRTTKPCPGCSEVNPYRSTDSVCDRCANLIDFAKQELARREREQPDVVLAACPPEGGGHWLEYLAHIPQPTKKAIQNGIIHLARLLDRGPRENAKTVEVFSKSSSYRSFQSLNTDVLEDEYTIYLDRAVAETIRDLYVAIIQSCDDAFRAGEEAGKSFIARLADGGVSIEELNREMKRSAPQQSTPNEEEL